MIFFQLKQKIFWNLVECHYSTQFFWEILSYCFWKWISHGSSNWPS